MNFPWCTNPLTTVSLASLNGHVPGKFDKGSRWSEVVRAKWKIVSWKQNILRMCIKAGQPVMDQGVPKFMNAKNLHRSSKILGMYGMQNWSSALYHYRFSCCWHIGNKLILVKWISAEAWKCWKPDSGMWGQWMDESSNEQNSLECMARVCRVQTRSSDT